MLNNRCSDILKLIVNSNTHITINDIAKKYSISARTTRYDLERIDNYLIEINLKPLIKKTNEGISAELNEEEIDKLFSLIGDINSYDYVMSQNERIIYIIYELLEKSNFTTINSLAENMFVSKGTINNDLREVKKWFEKNNIKLESIKGKGIKAIGEEVKLRKFASSLMFENSDKTNILDINLIKMFKDMDIEFISNAIKIAEEQMENALSDYSFNNLLIHIAIAIKRIELSKDIVMDEEELKNLSKTPEFAIASGIAKMLEERYYIEIPKNEIGYITIHILGSNVLLKEEKNDNLVYIQLIVSTLIEEIHKKTKYNFNMDKQLFDGLIQHIRPMIYRLKHGINIKNPLIDEIIAKYNDVFTFVQEGLIFLKRDLNVEIDKEEIGYITLHFMASLERIKNYNKIKPRVLVVCATGVGTSKFVSIKLKSIFDINIIDTISSHDIKKIMERETIDLIITTIPINIKAVKCILVSPFLTEKNISELSLFFSKQSLIANDAENKKTDVKSFNGIDKFYNSNLESKRNTMENVLTIINKNCTVNDYNTLKEELTSCLTIYNKVRRPSLNEIINSNFIKLNEDVSDWEEAVIKGGEILKNNGCINDSYINAMINNVKKLGSYIVILPGIAMPHASTGDGSLKIGFSIMTLKNPINFGNAENDPVKVIVTMSVIDNISHINALKELMQILEQDEFINKVSKVKTKDEVLKIFNCN